MILAMLLCIAMLCLALPAQAGDSTTSACIIKYDIDGLILDETNVTYSWMEANLPAHGNDLTERYHKGPSFDLGNLWYPDETANLKNKGPMVGTNGTDLCDLVGGMFSGDEVEIKASDGYHVEFGYTSVYQPQPIQGPMVLCWYNGEDMKVGERQGVGYPPDYFVGMRLVFFADNSINPDGKHVFGNWDMHECLPEQCYHFYELYPSTNGFSVKWVDELRVYSGGYTGDEGGPAKSMPESTSSSVPGFNVIPAVAGLLLVAHTLRRSMR